ncbi:hypothetical protein H632_c4571p0, partial [Helicosporidium sp. ATCC 50920]
MFSGLSTLREKDKKTSKPETEQSKQLKGYLANRYGATTGEERPKKRNKRRADTGALTVLDDDAHAPQPEPLESSRGRTDVSDFGTEFGEDEDD